MEDAAPGRAIGPYLLEELLGRGGMAEVYRARRQGPGGFEKVLALKRILPSYSRDPQLVARFFEEARVCARLDHSNIVSVVDFGSADGEYYLVMEWVDGASLFAVLRELTGRGERIPAEATAHVIAEAATGLHEAHSLADQAGRPLGLVHRDVSPQNVLLSRKGDVKVGDFGIAKAVGSSVRTAAGVLIGKLCYMSPEQARNETLDARADVYALGVVLWECLAGRPLFPRGFDGEAYKAVLEPRVPPPSEVSGSPKALDSVVARSLAPARADRYPDAAAFARDLRVWLHGVAPGFGPGDLAAFLERTGAIARKVPAASAPTTVTFGSGPAAAASPASSGPEPAAADAPVTSGPDPAATVPARRPIGARDAPMATAAPLARDPSVGAAGTSASAPSAGVPSGRAGGETAGAALAELPATRSQPAHGRRSSWTGCLIAAIVLAVAAIAGFVTCMAWVSNVAEQAQQVEPVEDTTGPRGRGTAGGPLRVDSVPQGAWVIADRWIRGTTPIEIDADSTSVGLVLRGYAPAILREPREVLASGPVRLVETSSEWALVDVDCGTGGRVVLGGQDLGTQPLLVVVELTGGRPKDLLTLDGSTGSPVTIDLGPFVRPWEIALLREGSGCP